MLYGQLNRFNVAFFFSFCINVLITGRFNFFKYHVFFCWHHYPLIIVWLSLHPLTLSVKLMIVMDLQNFRCVRLSPVCIVLHLFFPLVMPRSFGDILTVTCINANFSQSKSARTTLGSHPGMSTLHIEPTNLQVAFE